MMPAIPDTSTTALVLIDFLNDIVTEGGKLTGKGYGAYVRTHSVDDRVSRLLAHGRNSGWKIIHVRVGFSSDYAEHPPSSPLFGGAKRSGALALGGWGTEFAPFAVPEAGERVLVKHRVSAFYGTGLELLLRSIGVKNIVIAGCATDLAVQAAARDAHDRDFSVFVVKDACAAANDSDHLNSLVTLAKIASVVTVPSLVAETDSAT